MSIIVLLLLLLLLRIFQKTFKFFNLISKGTDVRFALLGEMDSDGEVLGRSFDSHHIDIPSHTTTNRSYHFAVTGEVFSAIMKNFPQLYARVLVCGTIFSRMLPDQKTSLVEGLQAMGYRVGKYTLFFTGNSVA